MKSVIKKLLLTVAVAGLAIVSVNTTDVQAKVQKYNVTFIYGTNVVTQQVRQGKDAVVPTNTDVPGFIFAGWSDTAANIQGDKVILGMYAPNGIQPSASKAPTNNPIGGRALKANNDLSAPGCDWWDYSLKGVPGQTCVVRWYNGHNGELWKTEVVPYGATLDDPGNPCISGYDFIGWVGSWENITEDRNIMAWYMHSNEVRYHDENGIFAKFYAQDYQTVRDADHPAAPDGWRFKKWSESRNSITGDKDMYPVWENIKTGEQKTGYGWF